jgi:transglutaminase-like putative cysteine protease
LRIRAGYRITYDFPDETAMLLVLNVRPERAGDLETLDLIETDPKLHLHQYYDGFGNLCTRLLAPKGRLTLSSDFVVRDSGEPDMIFPHAIQQPVHELPDQVLVFLMSSRYCEVDEMNEMAWARFGHIAPGWGLAQAIVDYAHDAIAFGYEHARPTKSASDAHAEGRGVCRDYAHLAITLCRSMNIPARYCTGYMGDIDWPKDGAMDFSAWMEVYLGGAWRTMDARHNVPRKGRIKMAVGRDATDVAISTQFGPSTLVGFEVISEELA